MPTNADTPVDLPAPVAAYFTTDAADAGGVARCFTGEFPGSPIKLRYRFTLAGDKVASLEITS